VRLKDSHGEERVIGMMAPKVQVMVTIPTAKELTTPLLMAMLKYDAQALIYLICPEAIECDLGSIMSSLECEKFSLKYGVYRDESCVGAIFVISKEGEIVYRDLAVLDEERLNVEAFDTALGEAIRFKKKGHTHEEWMGV
jgi:thioredoxin-dependent peroxiredoxin